MFEQFEVCHAACHLAERVRPNHVVYAPSPMPQSKKTMLRPALSSVATAYLSRITFSAMSISAPAVLEFGQEGHCGQFKHSSWKYRPSPRAWPTAPTS